MFSLTGLHVPHLPGSTDRHSRRWAVRREGAELPQHPPFSSQHPRCPQHPQGELLRKRRWWGGEEPLLELRGWEHFCAGSQTDFSSMVSALMHSLVLSSITPQTSRSYSPEGTKPWAVLADPWALTQQEPEGWVGWRNTRQP